MSLPPISAPVGWSLSVAPMIDWTDTHCRNFHRLLSPDAVLYTEMVHANAILHGPRARLLTRSSAENPVVLQLGGSDPAALADAAALGVEHGFDAINLNCGCPSDRVQAGRFGACLMREPETVAACVRAMADAVSVPVTVKCRLGVDQDDDYGQFRRFVDTVADAGCSHFVVHARNAWLKGLSPKENREIPPLRHDWAWRLKQERTDLRIELNGGIASVDAVKSHFGKVDGVMLGRAAYHEPYLLHELAHRWHGHRLQARETLMRQHRPYVEEQLAAGVPLAQMTRHWLGLFHAQPGGKRFRQHLSGDAIRGHRGWEAVEAALADVQATSEAVASGS